MNSYHRAEIETINRRDAAIAEIHAAANRRNYMALVFWATKPEWRRIRYYATKLEAMHDSFAHMSKGETLRIWPGQNGARWYEEIYTYEQLAEWLA